jgi:hypothetical protein
MIYLFQQIFNLIIIIRFISIKASRLRRDNLSSIAYSEKLNSSTISATLQSTDRRYGIVGQKRSHFQRAS